MKINVRIAAPAVMVGAFIIAASAQAVYVTPKICGSQVGGPMVMPEIFFNGQEILVFDELGLPWTTYSWIDSPYLRPLIPPNEFDGNMPWGILGYKPYNFQYGWDSAFLDLWTYPYPPGSGVWIRVLNQSPELECYYKDSGYIPIFTGDPCDPCDPCNIWYWNNGMRHNTYAVPADFYGRVFADYKVYIGNLSDGNELVDDSNNPLYGSAIVSFHWLRPSLFILQGDIDTDGIVDFTDFAILAAQWLDSTCSDPYWCDEGDIDKSGAVDITDLDLLTQNWLIDCHQTPGDPRCLPRPGPW
jgi:hypothetical protein